MPTKKPIFPSEKKSSEPKSENLYWECKQHYDIGFDETDKRRTGRGKIGTISFDEADEMFRSWINEDKWPYDSLVFDPRIFTFIFEKTSRLISNKPKGKLVPREGGDVLRGRINNSLLDFQWDQANYGGTMLSKWALMDINARKYGASFALNKWRYELDSKGKVVFDGPEMTVLNNRDCAHDLSATAIENCNWFQVRTYVTWQSLQLVNDQRKKPFYKNLDKLRDSISGDSKTSKGEGRGTNWQSRNREITGLEDDPYGQDASFKTIEICTEYRKDRWITFSPRNGVIIRDIENPYKNHEIPVVMLKYYSIDDDLYGLSEIEPVKGIQKAINAITCQYLDEIAQNLYTPIAISPGVKQHTLEWGKGARWLMNNPNTDYRLVTTQSNAAQYFNTTYSALVAAMMTALGESSLGVSNQEPYQTTKTATEVKALQLQRNARDNYNQIYLSEAIKRQQKLWFSMNQVLLFANEEDNAYVFRIVGIDALKYFKRRGLHKEEITQDSVKSLFKTSWGTQKLLDSVEGDEVVQRILKNYPDFLDMIAPDMDNYKQPKYPAKIMKDGKEQIVPKLRLEDDDDSGLISVEPTDLKGEYDFIVDVQSMTAGADETARQSREQAVTLLTSNPNVNALLMGEGVKPKFKELFIAWLEDLGMNDAQRYFEKAEEGQNPLAGDGSGGNPKEEAMAQALAGMQGKRGPRPNPDTPKVEGITPPGEVSMVNQPGGANETGQASPFTQGNVPTGQMPEGFQEEVAQAEGTNLQTISPESLRKALQ